MSTQNAVVRFFEFLSQIIRKEQTVRQIAAEMAIHERSIYRYINRARDAGFDITINPWNGKVCLDKTRLPRFINEFIKAAA